MQDVKAVYAADDTWYNEHIIVKGRQVTVLVNDKVINQYTEPDSVSQSAGTRKLSSGTIALQGHDPKSNVYFTNIRVRLLPD